MYSLTNWLDQVTTSNLDLQDHVEYGVENFKGAAGNATDQQMNTILTGINIGAGMGKNTLGYLKNQKT